MTRAHARRPSSEDRARPGPVDPQAHATQTSAWHARSSAEALRALGSGERGLSDAAADDRRARDGPNQIADAAARPLLSIAAGQLSSPMVLVLLAGAIVSLLVGEHRDAIGMLAIVVLNGMLGFGHEVRAERRIAALKRLAAPRARVRREGRLREIEARELVAGDIVLLQAGDVVPADARLLHGASCRAQEAALTGESIPVDKNPAATLPPDTSLSERVTMVYMGTVVVAGRGEAVAVATGMRTELGAIAALSEGTARTPTPLERRLADLGRRLAIAALIIVGLIFPLGILRGEAVGLMLRTAISMAAAAIPEGLPIVLTIALAIGAERMLKRRTLIRQLLAVETLGSVTVICTDKTGTLTENRLRVEAIETPGADEDETARALLLMSAALCNDARHSSSSDPTEIALVEAAAAAGVLPEELDRSLPRRSEVPFDPERRRMTTLHERTATPRLPSNLAGAIDALRASRTTWIAFTKGATEDVLDVCGWVLEHGTAVRCDEAHRQAILAAEARLASGGLRVLAFAYRAGVPRHASGADVERDLVYVGLAALADPPRPETAPAIATCRAAGIRPIMITGDHPATARAIARRVGIDHEVVITGRELQAMAPEDLADTVQHASVFARVAPEDKLRLVAALQARGDVVAMTGDGVNDAPALRKADIGIAMGRTGTEATRQIADAVLLDDDFATIVSAVEEGRVVFDNLRKFMRFMLTTNAAELLVMLIGPLAGMPLPLFPLQILWINLVTDGPAAIALALEPAERGVMARPPNTTATLVGSDTFKDVLLVGLPIAAVSLAMGAWYWHAGSDRWQTLVFTTITVSQLAAVLAMRSTGESYFSLRWWSNLPLLAALAASLAAQLAVLYTPLGQSLLGTRPLAAAELTAAFALSSVGFILIELRKRRRATKARRHQGRWPRRHDDPKDLG